MCRFAYRPDGDSQGRLEAPAEDVQIAHTPCDLSTIRQDSEGRFCLNDLHKAAGGEDRHRPARFLDLESTDDLRLAVKQDRKVTDNRHFSCVVTVQGRNGGTYVVKELVYAYAMWVSPAFHLKVIRFFDRGVKDGVAVADHAAADLLEAENLMKPLTGLRQVC